MPPETRPPGEAVVTAKLAEEGESGRTLIVIETGSVTVTVHGKEVGRLGAGDAFGEMSLIDRSARSATVKADTEVRGYQLPVWSFRPLIESHPEVAWSLMEALAQRVRAAEGRDIDRAPSFSGLREQEGGGPSPVSLLRL